MRKAHNDAMIETPADFKDALARTGAKMSDIARETGISQDKLSKIKIGARKISAPEATAIGRFFENLPPTGGEQASSPPTQPDVVPLDAASATVRGDGGRVGIEFDLGNAGICRVTLPADAALILGVDLEEAGKRARRYSLDSPSSASS